jgi:hypothetical protein
MALVRNAAAQKSSKQQASSVILRARANTLDCWLSENGEDMNRLLVGTGGKLRVPLFELFGKAAIADLTKEWAASEECNLIETKSMRPRRALRLLYMLIDNELADGRLEVQVLRPTRTWAPLAKVVAEKSFVSSSPVKTRV